MGPAASAWSAAFEQAPVGIAVCDTHGTLVAVNEYVSRFLRRDREQLLGSSVLAVLHPDKRLSGLSRWASMLAESGGQYQPGTGDRVKVTFLARDGSPL